MAASVNYDMDQGADFSFTLTAKNDDGTAKDILFEYSILGQMRKYYTSTTAINLTCTKITSSTGSIKVSLTAAQTAEIKPGVYFYDIELKASPIAPEPNSVKRLQQGMITVYPEITRY